MDYSQPSSAPIPLSSGLNQPTSSPSAPTPTVPKSPKSKRRWIWGIVLGLVLVVSGGGYFAYSRGYISIPFLSPDSDKLFEALVESLGKIDNAQYSLKATLKAEPRQAGAKSIFPSIEEQKLEEEDAERKSDLFQIRAGLALYFDDNNRYPETLGDTLTPKYLATMPTDPDDKSVYPYLVCDDGKHFVLYTGLKLGQYYSTTDEGTSATTDEAPTCDITTNKNTSGFLPWLIPTAHAQATTFSIESVGSQIGLGEAPTSDLPLVNLFSIFGLGDMESLIDVFPNDIDTSAAVTFYTEADKKLKEADALLKIVASYHGGDLTADFDVEGRKRGTTVYGIVRKFPGIPYFSQFVTPIKNTWVKITPDDGNSFLTEDTWQDTTIKDAVEKTKESLKLVLEGEAFTAEKTLGTESISGVQSAHYRLKIHPEKFKGIFEKIVADRKSKKLSTTDLESTIAELNRPNVQASLERFTDSSTVDIWIDKAQGLLRQISWNVVVVPPEGSTKLKDKQFNIGLTLTLDKVNKKVDVSAPGDTIDYNEAERLVTGMSKEEQSFNRQRSRVSGIRSALRGIKEASGTYPETIDNLNSVWKKAVDDCEAKKESTANTNQDRTSYVYCGYYYNSGGGLTNLDVYTKKPYGYKKIGDDYELTYEMKLDFSDTNSDYSYGSYYKEQYVEGLNTANGQDVSITKKTDDEIREEQIETNRNTNRASNTNTSMNTNSSTGYASIVITPPSLSLDATPGTTTTSKIKVLNVGTIATTYSTETLNAQKGPDGQSTTFSPATDRTNFAGWTKVTPTTLTLQPGASAEVSVTISVPAGTPPQLYLGGVMLVQTGSTGVPSKVGTLVLLTVVNGTNAPSTDADSDGVLDTVESTYGSSSALKDTDGDGLNDFVEIYTCQTSPTKKDTDGDTYEDKTEIQNGYNPNGAGQATNTYCKSYVVGY